MTAKFLWGFIFFVAACKSTPHGESDSTNLKSDVAMLNLPANAQGKLNYVYLYVPENSAYICRVYCKTNPLTPDKKSGSECVEPKAMSFKSFAEVGRAAGKEDRFNRIVGELLSPDPSTPKSRVAAIQASRSYGDVLAPIDKAFVSSPIDFSVCAEGLAEFNASPTKADVEMPEPVGCCTVDKYLTYCPGDQALLDRGRRIGVAVKILSVSCSENVIEVGGNAVGKSLRTTIEMVGVSSPSRVKGSAADQACKSGTYQLNATSLLASKRGKVVGLFPKCRIAVQADQGYLEVGPSTDWSTPY